MLLTIAIPTYNRLSMLKECLGRVLDEIISIDSVEILVSDNASEDGTESYMKKIIEDNPLVSYYRNAKNIGPDRNFLNCYNKATGKYVWIIGDDDFLLPGAINSVLELLKEKPVFVHINSCNLESFMPFKHGKSRFENTECMRFTDKNKFFEKIGVYITFVSSLIMRKDLIEQINDKEDYIGSYFIQSHLALRTMATKGTYIINTYNCLAASPNKVVNYDLYFVWFECYQKLLMETGVMSGFSQNLIEQIYYDSTKITVHNFVIQFRKSCWSYEKNWNKNCVLKCLEMYPDLKKQFRRTTNCSYFALHFWSIYYRIKQKWRKDRKFI